MGYNKRYIGIDNIRKCVKDGGLKNLGVLFSNKVDTFIFTDNLSSDIYHMFFNEEHTKIRSLIRLD
jgi:hypothetical protein